MCKLMLWVVSLLCSTLLASTPVLAADVANGARIYGIHCIACHGMQGQSALPNVPNFAIGERMMQPDFALMQSIRTGKDIMPAFFGILRDQEILDVIAYLRTLRR